MVHTQVHVPETRQKCHCQRQNKILYYYDEFSTYVVIGSLRSATNFKYPYVQRRVITCEASRVLSRIYFNNNKTTVLSTLFIPYVCGSYQ